MAVEDDFEQRPDFQEVAVPLLAKADTEWHYGHFDEAETLYREVIARFPERPEGYNKVGVVYAEKHDLSEARHWFQSALSRDSNYVPSLTNLGNVLLEGGSVDEAIVYYTMAINNDPNYVPAHRNMAVALRRQGRYFDAVRHLRRTGTNVMGNLANFGFTPPPKDPRIPEPMQRARSNQRGRPNFGLILLFIAIGVFILVQVLHR
ncbi:MAG: tetratricopeptide repeat protein [Clostridia bacterium]|jgi:tetratricopeptide (TPR) repeat protein